MIRRKSALRNDIRKRKTTVLNDLLKRTSQATERVAQMLVNMENAGTVELFVSNTGVIIQNLNQKRR